MKKAVTGLLIYLLFLNASLVLAAPQKVPLSLTQDLKAELTGVDYRKLSEENLYVEVLNRYQANKSVQLEHIGRIFLNRFPTSNYADNVLYLMGYSSLENKKYSEALRHFELLTRKYPNSNKAVSAEFAKGSTYKKMRLNKQAQMTFLKLRKKYPGSPEFYRAESELKILTMK
ncbi:MAG: tetratricopeptide repeat protein [Bdellovibrionales bacterium]